MKSVVYTSPGILELRERPIPTPGTGEVLIRVARVGICGSDLLLWEGGFDRVTAPVTLGHEFSGVVDDPGESGLARGDRVVVEPLVSCGTCSSCTSGNYNACANLRLFGIDFDGAAASHVVVPAARVHGIPDDLSLRHAALAEPTAVACHMSRRAGVKAGDNVLIAGGGPIGVLVSAVCRALGAALVIVSEPNDERREHVDAAGATTFDPKSGDLRSTLLEGSDGFDVAFELTGVAPGLAAVIDAVRPQATVLLGGLPHHAIPMPVASAVLKELTIVGSRVYRSEDFEHAIALLADGTVPAEAMITREVALEDSIDDAYMRLRDLRTDMKILINPGMEL